MSLHLNHNLSRLGHKRLKTGDDEVTNDVREQMQRSGEWTCNVCGDLQFARNTACRKCRNPRPSYAGSAPRGSGSQEAAPARRGPNNQTKGFTHWNAPQFAESLGGLSGGASSDFVGRVKDIRSGYGFIACNETKKKYGRDVYLPWKQMQGVKVGDWVNFSVYTNDKGEPQAHRVVMAGADAEALQKRREKDQHDMQQQLHQKVAQSSGSSGNAIVMDEEQARRFQASLKRSRS